jgi:hypothetical protein
MPAAAWDRRDQALRLRGQATLPYRVPTWRFRSLPPHSQARLPGGHIPVPVHCFLPVGHLGEVDCLIPWGTGPTPATIAWPIAHAMRPAKWRPNAASDRRGRPPSLLLLRTAWQSCAERLA